MDAQEFERAWSIDYKALAREAGQPQPGSPRHTFYGAILNAKVAMASEHLAKQTAVLAYATVVLALATVVLVVITAFG